jgi:hypothetical protein
MKTVTFDARALFLYPVGKPGFTGGTEHMVRVLARHLSQWYTVNVVTPDLDEWEPRGENLYYWPPTMFPRKTDVLVMVQSLEGMDNYTAPVLAFATNGIDPIVGNLTPSIDLYPCFSQTHIDMMTKARLTIPAERCVITGLGVDLPDMLVSPCKGLMCWMNDPARGLWHMLDIFDEVRKRIDTARLAVTYNFELQFSHRKWQQSQMAQVLWECRERMQKTSGVEVWSEMTREQVIGLQQVQHVHVMPSDPPNQGSQIHGMAQLESASFGTPLVLADTEAFPEVFGQAADILPLPGTYVEGMQRRVTSTDWADVIEKVMLDETVYQEMRAASLELARQNTWAAVACNWHKMLESALG